MNPLQRIWPMVWQSAVTEVFVIVEAECALVKVVSEGEACQRTSCPKVGGSGFECNGRGRCMNLRTLATFRQVNGVAAPPCTAPSLVQQQHGMQTKSWAACVIKEDTIGINILGQG